MREQQQLHASREPAGNPPRDLLKIGSEKPGKHSYDPVLHHYRRQKQVKNVPLYDAYGCEVRPDYSRFENKLKKFNKKKVGLSEWNDTSFYIAKFMGSTTNSFDVTFKPVVSKKDWHPERPNKNSARKPYPGGFNPDEMADIGPMEYADGSRTRWPDAPYEHYPNHNSTGQSHARRVGTFKDQFIKTVQNPVKTVRLRQQQLSPKAKLQRKAVREGMSVPTYESTSPVCHIKNQKDTGEERKAQAVNGWVQTVVQPQSPTVTVSPMQARRRPIIKTWRKKIPTPRAASTLKMNGWIKTVKTPKKNFDVVFGAGENDSAIDQLNQFEIIQMGAFKAKSGDALDNAGTRKIDTFPCPTSNHFPSVNLDGAMEGVAQNGNRF